MFQLLRELGLSDAGAIEEIHPRVRDRDDIAVLILTGINQNPWAHFRRPIDMIFQG